jgi:tRNA(fMet)-specific endonuclease VapC
MLVALDTNHFTAWVEESDAGIQLKAKCQQQEAAVFTTIVTSQESAEGWFALIRRKPSGQAQVPYYGLYHRSLDEMQELGLLAFDFEAAIRFEYLKKQLPRIGTMDLKIAAICLAHDAMLLSRNRVDFEKVPGLRIENWLD